MLFGNNIFMSIEKNKLATQVILAIKLGAVYELDNLFQKVEFADNKNLILTQILSFVLSSNGQQFCEISEKIHEDISIIFEKEHMEQRLYSASVILAEKYAITQVSEAQRVANKVVEIIENEFSDDKLSLLKVAGRLSISHGHLSALIKKTLGRNFKELLIEKRMNEAYELVATTDLKVLEVARKCGFSDPYHFSFSFKKRFGLSPNRLRQKINENRNL